MAILKRRQSQDAEGLKRQPHAVASELENIQSSPPVDHSNTTATAVQGATKAAQPVFGLDDLASSKLSSPAAFTHILDVAQPVEPSLRGEDLTVASSTSAPTLSSSSSQFRTSRPPGKMTSRPPEQDFGNVRALSRFLRATGPLDLDEAHLGHAFSSQSFSAQPLAHDRPFLSMSLNSVPPTSSVSRAPVSSSDYFKALDARLDQYDQDINVDAEDSPPPPPPRPAKSIRKSRSIGESFAIKARARSHSSATRLESAGTMSPPILPPSPALPHALAVPSYNLAPTSPSPLPLSTSSGNAQPSNTGNKLKAFGGLATILRRKKSGSATATGTSRKGNGHNRRAGIGSDDFFVPPSELGLLPSSDLSVAGSKASPFRFVL